jgi:hypothetical protein
MRRRYLFSGAILAVVIQACGQGGSSSGGPVEPPAPIDGANIVATSGLNIGLCNGPGAGCFYSQEYSNSGSGCANNLHGKVRLYEDESLLATDDWWLDPTFVLRPGESAPIEDCCFGQEALQRRTRIVEETFWNNVPCS